MARQPDTTPKGGGVKALSSRLLQMKFMKRGQGSETATQATSSAVEAQVSVIVQALCLEELPG